MFRRISRRIIEHGAELAIAIILVLVCFLLLLRLLGIWFPEGTSIGTLVSGDSALERERQGLIMNLSEPGQVGTPLDATLTAVSRKVMDKPPTAISWTPSKPGQPLSNRHAIQTADNSGATITFGNRDQIELGENSLVVIRDFSRKEYSGKRTASLVMLGGTLTGQIENDEEGEPLEIEVHTGNVVAQIQPPEGNDDAEFQVVVNEDQSSTITVFDAEAEVTVGGTSIVLKPNNSTTITESGQHGPIRSIPIKPAIRKPLDGNIYYYREQSPEIVFDWESEDNDVKFDFVLARDPEFLKVVTEAQVNDTSFVHGNLGEGEYFWKVTGVNDHTRGRPSSAGRFEIVQDREPPALSVALPDEVIGERMILIRGLAEPGCQVFVARELVATLETGEFEHGINLKHGPNVIVIEAVDSAGNTSYESKVIHAKY